MDLSDLWIRPLWLLRQMIPTLHRTTYIEDGKRHFVVWWMWLGRSFWKDDVILADDSRCANV